MKLFTFLAVCCFLSCATVQDNNLSPKDFEKKLKATKDAVLIDVRTQDEFNSGHLEGAINLDLNNGVFASSIMSLDKTKKYFIYCKSGGRSAKAVDMMKTMGFHHVYELAGGYNAWAKNK